MLRTLMLRCRSVLPASLRSHSSLHIAVCIKFRTYTRAEGALVLRSRSVLAVLVQPLLRIVELHQELLPLLLRRHRRHRLVILRQAAGQPCEQPMPQEAFNVEEAIKVNCSCR